MLTGYLHIKPQIRVASSALQWRAVCASGPGGQNVNKVASKVELRVALADLEGFDEKIRLRLQQLAGAKINRQGELIITSARTRDQIRNRHDALDKLQMLLMRAQEQPKKRKPTKIPQGVTRRRLADKRANADKKRQRGRVGSDSD